VETWILAGLCIVLAALLLYNLRELRILIRWLEHGHTPEPPRAHGSWDRLHAALHRGRRESIKREAELAHALTRWREAARALPDGVVILDGDRIAWANDTAREHLDIDPAKDSGVPLTHLVRIPEFLEYLRRGEFDKPVIVRPGEGERVLSMRVVSYGSDQRLVLTRDITQFERVERMRSEFVANVSHELRTPLTVISGFLETLRDEDDAGARQRYLDLMTGQSHRMQRLVEDLLTLSALESSPPPPMEDVVDMRSLSARLAAEARALSNGRHRIEVEADAPVDLVGSEKELASAFGNLVSNAIRYTPDAGMVRMRWRPTDDGAEFIVEDTGIGIAPEHVPRLTERFYRVDRGRSRETGGTGLGLAIVKHALMRHGASLHVDSKPGQGSRFSARFTGARLKHKLGSDPN
jgi:two-component system phosphate regulon sensor histidine kinase PhoR